MSRIGNRIIMIPEGVTVEQKNGIITVTGPKGTLTQKACEKVNMNIENNEIRLTIEDQAAKPMHGTMNALITNMIIGVSKGYEKGLEIIGVGYRFNVQGNKLVVNAGYSHPVELIIPEGITAEVEGNTKLKLQSINKEKIGEFAANIRKIRKPEPYKGKGIRYIGEHVRRKEGKKAA